MPGTTLTLPTDVLKMLYNGIAAEIIGIKSFVLMVENDRVVVKHINDMNSALIKFESKELNLGMPDKVVLPIDTADLKTVLGLAKDVDKITFIIDAGTTTCKIGKIKKKFAQPALVPTVDKDPKFEVSATMEFNDVQSAEIISTFSDLKEQGDLKVVITTESLSFGIEDENRATEIIFGPADLTAFNCSAAVKSGYDLKMAISIFKTKVKGSTFKFEFGSDVPIRVTQIADLGTMNLLLAPKIYT